MTGGDHVDGTVNGGMISRFRSVTLGGILLGALPAIIGGFSLGSIIGHIFMNHWWKYWNYD